MTLVSFLERFATTQSLVRFVPMSSFEFGLLLFTLRMEFKNVGHTSRGLLASSVHPSSTGGLPLWRKAFGLCLVVIDSSLLAIGTIEYPSTILGNLLVTREDDTLGVAIGFDWNDK